MLVRFLYKYTDTQIYNRYMYVVIAVYNQAC